MALFRVPCRWFDYLQGAVFTVAEGRILSWSTLSILVVSRITTPARVVIVVSPSVIVVIRRLFKGLHTKGSAGKTQACHSSITSFVILAILTVLLVFVVPLVIFVIIVMPLMSFVIVVKSLVLFVVVIMSLMIPIIIVMPVSF
jgi:hypothetical protein